MANKILWLDTETTGLDPWKQDVIQIAGLVEIDHEVVEEFEFKCQPHNYDNVQDAALQVHGYSIDDLRQFDSPMKTWNKFRSVLDNYIDPYNKRDKFIMAGYNVKFDLDMMKCWWQKCQQQYFGSYFEYKVFDVFPLVFFFDKRYQWGLPSHELVTIADFMGIEFNAHDAMADITTTRDIYLRLTDALPQEFNPHA